MSYTPYDLQQESPMMDANSLDDAYSAAASVSPKPRHGASAQFNTPSQFATPQLTSHYFAQQPLSNTVYGEALSARIDAVQHNVMGEDAPSLSNDVMRGEKRYAATPASSASTAKRAETQLLSLIRGSRAPYVPSSDLSSGRARDQYAGGSGVASPGADDGGGGGNESNSNTVVACFALRGKRLGVAYYDTRKGRMALGECAEDADMTALHATLDSVDPDTVVTCLKANGVIFEHLKAYRRATPSQLHGGAEHSGGGDARSKSGNVALNVRHVKATFFDFNTAIRRLLNLNLPCLPPHATEAERRCYLKSVIDEGDHVSIQCAGALLLYLVKNLATLGGGDDERGALQHDANMIVTELVPFTLIGTMHIDRNSLNALQVFSVKDTGAASARAGDSVVASSGSTAVSSSQSSKKRRKASTSSSVNAMSASHGGGGGATMHAGGNGGGAVSLFGLLDHTRSRTGHALLRQWLQRPLSNATEINRRSNNVAFFVSAQRAWMVPQLQKQLSHVHDAAQLVTRLRGATMNVNDYDLLQRTVAAFTHIRQLCCDEGGGAVGGCGLDLLDTIATLGAHKMTETLSLIGRVLDLEESKHVGRVVVRDGVDEELDECKRFYDGLGSFFNRVGQEEMRTLAPSLPVHQINIAYYPQLGCQIMVPRADIEALSADVLQRCGLDFQFGTDTSVFYKNARMRELDAFLGDLYSEIVDMEAAVVRELDRQLLQRADTLLDMARVAAQLDCTLALATAASQNGWVRAIVHDGEDGGGRGGQDYDDSFIVEQARHPLFDACLRQVVPNDIRLDRRDGTCIKVISGANLSGKSSYIKMVGLIAVMAHTGSFVPATAARIGCIDRIFTRLHGDESAAAAASAFLLDCHQVSAMLRSCTRNSLLLVDEFGTGTNTNDGIALLGATVEHLELLGEQCVPKALFTTHFAELLRADNVATFGKNVHLCTMDFAPLDKQDAAALSTTSTSAGAVRHEQPSIAHWLGADNTGERAARTDVVGDNGHEEIVFTYRLIDGIAPSSFGMQCAVRSGVPAEVVRRATEVRDALARGDPVPPLRASSYSETPSGEARNNVLQQHNAQQRGSAPIDTPVHVADAKEGETPEQRTGASIPSKVTQAQATLPPRQTNATTMGLLLPRMAIDTPLVSK